MSDKQLIRNLDISLRQLNVHLRSSFPNQLKLAVIRGYNQEQGYPEAGLNGHPDLTKVLYNGALNEIQYINQEIFGLPEYDSIFIHPLSDYPLADQAAFVGTYKELLGQVNHPRIISICDGHDHNTFQVETREVSTDGYWITVCRTIFLDRPLTRVSYDIFAPSSVRAPPDHNDLLIAPIGIIYSWPLGLRGPHEPTPPSSDDGDSSE
jgi:hypothetical protein